MTEINLVSTDIAKEGVGLELISKQIQGLTLLLVTRQMNIDEKNAHLSLLRQGIEKARASLALIEECKKTFEDSKFSEAESGRQVIDAI
jgi:hypothetical protein